MVDCLVRFCQSNETFRLPELQALALIEGIDLKVLDYSLDSPFCLINVPSTSAARALVRRSILTQSIHELWATAPSGLWADLYASARERSVSLAPPFKKSSFKFDFDCYQRSRAWDARVPIINSFAFLPLEGDIDLKKPDELFTIFEEWPFLRSVEQGPDPARIFLGRWLSNGARDLCYKYDLKKRGYISTTSMDSELAFVTANMALAAPGKLIYDPFVGTGSFPIAAAHFGALTFGSDIDGRSIRGQSNKKSLRGNFAQYGLSSGVGDFFAADLTNTPLAKRRWMDGIVCDPPYGIREGLKVLGARDTEKRPSVLVASRRYGNSENFIPPKKPYSFLTLLDDILQFAFDMLVDQGRLSFWMPTANDQDQEIPVPSHPGLEIVSVCTQPFNKWSRRLITYRRLPDPQVNQDDVAAWKRSQQVGKTADELNPFRESYFKGFKRDEVP